MRTVGIPGPDTTPGWAVGSPTRAAGGMTGSSLVAFAQLILTGRPLTTVGLAGEPTVVVAAPTTVTFGAAMVTLVVATRLMFAPDRVMPSGVMLMMLGPAVIWTPTGDMTTLWAMVAVVMVIVGGTSLKMIWLPTGVR